MAHPRTPIVDLKLAGGNNLTRALNRTPIAANKFAAGVPDVPAHLNANEREVWDRVIALLSARGTLTEGDGFAIERYAVLYARWRGEQIAIAEEGTMIEMLKKVGKDHLGAYVRVPNPRLKILQATERQLLTLDLEFGLTPRHRGKPGETKGAMSLEELMSFPGSAS